METVSETISLERAVEVVRALGPEEQAQLRAMMDSWRTLMPSGATPEQQRRLAERLLADGIIACIPEGYPEGYVEPPPIVVRGRPVSETLLEDREPR